MWHGRDPAIRTSSSGAREAVPAEPADPEHPEYEELHQLLWFPRSGQRGRAQKRAFIREGVQQGYLSPTHPHLATGIHPPLGTFNFLARSRVQVDTAVQNRLVEEHRRAEALRGEDIVLLLPETVCTSNARNEALQFAKTAEANANSQAMQYACVAKAQARSHVNAL